MRFLSPLQSLSENLLYKFTHIDYKKDFALVALAKERCMDSIIGVSRYAFQYGDRASRAGVVVRDDWQGRGLGKLLLSRVVSIGRENGFSCFEALIDSQNDIIMKLLKHLGHPYKIGQEEQGTYLIEIQA
jgi:acetyltransferase